MATVFSGTWQVTNQPLMAKLNHLATIAKNEFDIEISIEKMLNEVDYRQLVLSELTQLSHPQINDIATWLSPVAPAIEIAIPQEKKQRRLVAVLFSVVILLLAAFLWMLQSSPKSTDTHNKVKPQLSQKSQLTEPLVSPVVVLPTKAPIKKVETLFRLHGSNTIGEKLAPMLLEGFLQQQGVTKYSWEKHTPLERELTYFHEGKYYAIELKAHGSSTSFQGLKDKVADIGMSSRQIKASEVNQLTSVAGQLNKLGNEHIIGLDGLAVIVNQNNAVKQLSSQTLAKVFSGEISNWSQIGGASMPIKLYARDSHSGTWDTFKNLVLKKHDKKLSKQAQRFESSSSLSTLVSQNEGAIGFIGLNYVLHNKALAISESKDTHAIFPTRFTIGTEDYALSRRLYFYTPTSASSVVKDFAQYALSTQGQQIVAKAGLISQNIKLEQVYPLDDAPQKYQQYADKAERLSLNFRFDYATKDLDNKGKRDLLRLVDFMEDHPNRRVVLMGFSDSIGAQLKNQSLSRKRAQSVELALTSRGIPVLAVEGMGEALPIANNDTEAGRKRNRRVEVWLL